MIERLKSEVGKPTTWGGSGVICLWCDRMVSKGFVLPKTNINGSFGGVCEGNCAEALATALVEPS